MAFIDDHRDRFGVEPICRVLTEHGAKIAPNTYWCHKKRPPSKRAIRDAELVVEIQRVYDENLFVYGADKIRSQLNDEGIRVARCTVERLMRQIGISGARRGKTWTATTDSAHDLDPADRPRRTRLRGAGPEPLVGRGHRLRQDLLGVGVRGVHHRRLLEVHRWLASVTLAAQRPRDRRVGDGRVEPLTRQPRPIGARAPLRPWRPAQYLSIRYSDHLAANDIVASVGSRGDSYDNAMAESFNGLYKWELIYRQGPWRGLDDIEFATLEYVDWFNNRRLHGTTTDDPTYTTPAAFEGAYYRQTTPALEPATQ